MTARRISDFGISIGKLPRGPRNALTDVPGVAVGHCTVRTQAWNTGVTVILPAQDNLFLHKVVGACQVLNGFGKTLGLMQLEELGTIETPIALTNTLNVGLVHDALVQYSIDQGHAAGVEVESVNPIVCECNDAGLSDIQHRAIGYAQVMEAISSAGADFAQGCVGAGTGTFCHSLKGGIGSASRLLEVDGKTYALGVLVQTNHGMLSDLRIDGAPVGREIEARTCPSPTASSSACCGARRWALRAWAPTSATAAARSWWAFPRPTACTGRRRAAWCSRPSSTRRRSTCPSVRAPRTWRRRS